MVSISIKGVGPLINVKDEDHLDNSLHYGRGSQSIIKYMMVKETCSRITIRGIAATAWT